MQKCGTNTMLFVNIFVILFYSSMHAKAKGK